MKKLFILFAVIFTATQSYAQYNDLTTYNETELQPATTDFSAVSIHNEYDRYTKSFKVVANVLGQTIGHNVAGFYVMAEIYSGNTVIGAFSKQIANYMNGPIPSYTSFSTDYMVDYNSNTLIYEPVILSPYASKVVYRVVSLNDPDMDGSVNSEDISTREYTVYIY